MTLTSMRQTAAGAAAAPHGIPRSLGDIVRGQRGGLIVSGLLAIVSAACSLVPYVAVYAVTVALFVDDAPERISTIAIWTAAALLARALSSAAAEHIAHVTAYRILCQLRLALAENLRTIPLGRVQARSAGELKKILHDDVEQLEEAFAHGVPDGSAAAAVPLATTAILFAIDWRLALVALAALVLLVVISASGMMLAQRNNTELAAHGTVITRAVMGYLRGIVVIRAYLRAGAAFGQARTAIEHGADLQNRATSGPLRWLVAVMAVGTSLTVALLLPSAGLAFDGGSVDLGTLVLFLVLALGYLTPIVGLVGTLATIMSRIQLAAGSVTELLAEEPLAASEHPRVPERFDVTFDQVSFGYRDDTLAIAGLDLAVPDGSTLALVGPTGSGKSTIARLIARFYDTTDGSVSIGGVDVRAIPPDALARIVAFVQQDEYVFAATLLENIRIARPTASDDEVIAAAEAAQLAEVADGLPDGWHTDLPAGGGRLSGGQRQRIAVARALLKDSPIIVLDEATASLDAASERRTLAAIRTLTAGRTVIAIAHRLDTIRDAESIAFIEHGRIAARGTHDQLLTGSNGYRDLWRSFTEAAGWHLERRESAGAGAASSSAASANLTGKKEEAEIGASADPRSLEDSAAGIVQPGLADMGFFAQWQTMYGRSWRPLLRQGLPRILAESLLRGTPMVAVVVVILAALDVLPGITFDSGFVWLLTGFLLAAMLLRVLASAWSDGLVWNLAANAKADLQLSILDRLRQVPLGFFQRVNTGRVGSLVTTDSVVIDFQNLPGQLLGSLVQPIYATAILLVIDWRLALAVLIGLPLFWITTIWSDRVFQRVFSTLHAARGEATEAMLEQAQGAAALRSNPNSSIAVRYRDAVVGLERASVEMSVRATPATALGSVALELGQVVLIMVGGALFATGAVPAATLVIFLFLTLTIYQPFQELATLTGYRRNQQQIAARVAEVWDAPVLPEPAVPVAPSGATVELTDTTFTYELADEPALHGVNLRAEEGRVTALVGPSGSGKSTIAHLIARFWDADAGSVRIGGEDVRDIGTDGVFNRVATVFQHVYLFDATVRFNVALGRTDVDDDRIWEVLRAAQCEEFVSDLPDGLDTELTDGGADLSGGQRQRLAIARALLKDSPILILDEAASAVDPGTEERIQQALGALAAGRTVIVIAHRIATIRGADRIVVVDQGRIDAIGTHDELLTASAVYRRLAAAQNAADA